MTTRQTLTLLSGIVSAVFATLLLSLALFLALTGSSARQPIIFAVISVFPLLIAIACLSSKHRTPAIRLVGGITALALAGVLLNSFVNPQPEIGRLGPTTYLAMCAGGVAIAANGRWPS
ncbi:hypothetical protein K227x_27580 [Rubripirellula lacrimiformis]|uniref:Transmembrane protein n=1 Tax=Rubripirellula lacrimiformis TaxID=1930273 RepID=A0A517NB55_9BACT|nr:hypothetical protein K227x_27580 [Rubripirellula lacrimiformis]